MSEGPGRNPDPRVTRTRARVLAATIDLLAERGYSGFSIEGIVDRTGIAKTTLYRHWRSREALLAAAIVELGGAGPLPDTGSVRQDLQDLLARRVHAARTPRWERCMPALVEASARHPELAEMVARLTARALGQIETLLRRGIERGELRPRYRPAARRLSADRAGRVPPPPASRTPHQRASLRPHRHRPARHRRE